MRALSATTIALALAACAPDSPFPNEPPSAVPPTAAAAAAGTGLLFTHVSPAGRSGFSCGVATTAVAYCWGQGLFGELGDGSDTAVDRLSPFPVAGGHRFLDVRSNGYSCGVTTDYAAWCWGANTRGNLGDGTTTTSSVPVPVSGTRKFRQIDVGADGHTCGVTLGNVLFCWGNNAFGQVGDKTRTERHLPVHVGGTLRFVEVSAGMLFTCAVSTDQRVFCWGLNRDGNLGDGTLRSHLAPHLVAGTQRYLQVSADAGIPGEHYACAVATTNRIFCWGSNDAGRFGDGTRTSSLVPHAMPGSLRFTQVSAGESYTCAVTTDHRGYCWGDGSNGQLGTGLVKRSLTPVPVAGGRYFQEIRTDEDHTCGVALSQRGLCWGSNFSGQLGDGTTDTHLAPTVVGG